MRWDNAEIKTAGHPKIRRLGIETLKKAEGAFGLHSVTLCSKLVNSRGQSYLLQPLEKTCGLPSRRKYLPEVRFPATSRTHHVPVEEINITDNNVTTGNLVVIFRDWNTWHSVLMRFVFRISVSGNYRQCSHQV
jgi:hypothetical protein